MSPPRRRIVAVVITFAVVAGLGAGLAVWQAPKAMAGPNVARGVHLEGRHLGGMSDERARHAIAEIAREIESRPVTLTTPNGQQETTAGALGVRLDQQATLASVLATDKGGGLATEIRNWIGSFFGGSTVAPVLVSDAAAVAETIAELAAANRVEPVEPALIAADGVVTVVAPTAGRALDPRLVAERTLDAARTGAAALIVSVEPSPLEPKFTAADAQPIAEAATRTTARGLTVQVADRSAVIAAGTVQRWLRLDTSGTTPVLAVDETTVLDDVRNTLGDIGDAPVDTGFTVDDGGAVRIVDGRDGSRCCAPDSPARVTEAITSGRDTVRLDLEVIRPEHDRAWAEGLQITEAVGTFTTRHACCEPRVTNIHRIADLTRGMVIEPGATFSVNERVGERTRAKGFVEAPVIYNGRMDRDVGGGVSQYVTTLFNAAFFAGLDIPEYQSHTLYISRYPYGREATISFPSPDLKITNNTPYGILLWPTYTSTSITVTLYSTAWVKGEQTGQTKTPQARCDKVTTERTRTWLADGRTATDTFTAYYQYNEGVKC